MLTEMTQLPIPHRFRVSDYHEMARVGILNEDDRVELLDGIVVTMPPIRSRHAWCVFRITELFHAQWGGSLIVWVQSPIVLGDESEPTPDITILRGDVNTDALPTGSDVLLLVEVADPSGGYERSTKGRLYASFGIPEYWIVDLAADRIDVFREPRRDGYGVAQTIRRGESISAVTVSGIQFSVDEILG
jgi:Uma2 family endonuclease